MYKPTESQTLSLFGEPEKPDDACCGNCGSAIAEDGNLYCPWSISCERSGRLELMRASDWCPMWSEKP